MTVMVKIVEDKYRLVEEQTGEIAITKNGTPLDGGGHKMMDSAIRQAGKINVATKFRTTEEQKKLSDS